MSALIAGSQWVGRRLWRSPDGARSVLVSHHAHPDRYGMLPVFDEREDMWKVVSAHRVYSGGPLPTPKSGARHWDSPQAWRGERWWQWSIIERLSWGAA